MRPALKLLILIAVIVTLAGPAGWKWSAKPKTTKALAYMIAPADRSAPVSSTSPDTSLSPDGWTWDAGE